MRVVYLTSSSEIGGGNQSFLSLWKGLRRNGVSLLAVCPSEGPMTALCRETKIPCESMEYRQPAWRQGIQNWRGYRQWRHLLTDFGADLVHANDLFGARSIIVAAWRLGVPLVCHIRFPSSRDCIRWSFRRLPKPDCFLFNSRALQELTGSEFATTCPHSEQQVIHNGVDLENYQPRPKLDEQTLRVGIVANLWPIKGHKDFLAVARLILEKGYACEFWIIGDDISHSGYRDQLVQLAAEMRLGSAVKFLGFRNDVANVLSQLDILVSCSHYEPFGRSLIEAMACGRPVVATAVGGVQEVVENGITGFLVEPSDPHALACAVEQLLKNKSLRYEMGRAGRARVEALFSSEAHVKQVMKTYETLLWNQSRPRLQA